MTILPTLLLSRQKRFVGVDWTKARSWLGGAPRLGGLPWPRSKIRKEPLYFLAQIDLTEVFETVGQTPLPASGSLAFFLEMYGDEMIGAVLHVPHPLPSVSTPPPADALPVYEAGGNMFPNTTNPAAPRLFPYWPVDITALNLKRGALYKVKNAAVEQHVMRRECPFFTHEVFKVFGGVPRPTWWHSGILYRDRLRTALDEAPRMIPTAQASLSSSRRELSSLRQHGSLQDAGEFKAYIARREIELEAYIARQEIELIELRKLLPLFQSFVEEVHAWATEEDPWSFMDAESAEQLALFVKRGKGDFSEFICDQSLHYMDDLVAETTFALLTAKDDAYATLPESIRTLVNEKYLLPPIRWHQMLGDPIDIQGNAAYEDEGNHMLLRLMYDDMMHWRFGDMGAYQFFISPEDLAQRNWDAVQLTFEGH